MKNILKRISSLLMAVLTCATVLSVWAFAANGDEFKNGDIVEYGIYPQSKVEDEDIIAKLTKKAGSVDEWKSYGYYSGTGVDPKTGDDFCYDGKMASSDFMKFKDVKLNNEKYRGVFFTDYRPEKTGDCLVKDDLKRGKKVKDKDREQALAENKPLRSASIQDDNEYLINTIYWFKFEPIEWRVLDAEAGFLMCNTVLDAQAYNNFVAVKKQTDDTEEEGKKSKKKNGDNDYYADKKFTKYAADYSNSSIREWLNEVFYKTAFTSKQRKNIKKTELDLDSNSDCTKTESAKVTDKIFLLSKEEVCDENLGFKISFMGDEKIRVLSGTAYAKCQGLLVNEEKYKSPITDKKSSCWLLRTPTNPNHIHFIAHDGFFRYGGTVNDSSYTSAGVVPALKLKDLSKCSKIDGSEGVTNIFDNKEIAKNNGAVYFVIIIVVLVIIAVIIVLGVIYTLKKKKKSKK